MSLETLSLKETNDCITLTLNRVQQKNAINSMMLQELNRILDYAEEKKHCRLIILEGQEGFFCTGMDFQELTKKFPTSDSAGFHHWTSQYMATLKRFATTSKVIVASVDGAVIAGGVGLAAASDLVIATKRSSFKLSEALWGLLPSMVAPYLIRRIGFQKTYALSLTCQTVEAQEAHSFHLIDVLTDNPHEAIQEILRRVSRLEITTVSNLKAYFRKLWIINESMENAAVDMTTTLLSDPIAQAKIMDFIERGRSSLPWEPSI